MSESNDGSPSLKVAKTLFGVTILLVIVYVLYQRGQFANAEAQHRYYVAASMLHRCQSSAKGGMKYYSGLLKSAWTRPLPANRPKYEFVIYLEYVAPTVDRLAEQIASINSSTTKIGDRISKYRELLRNCPETYGLVKALNDDSVLKPLANADKPDDEDRMYWIEYNIWPISAVPSTERFNSDESRDNQLWFWHLQQEYEANIEPARALDVLEKEVDTDFERVDGEQHSPPQVKVPDTDLTIRMRDVLGIGGAIILVLQLMYLIEFERKPRREVDGSGGAFPQFNSPDDPFTGDFPSSLAEGSERAIWLLFLALPTTIIALGLFSQAGGAGQFFDYLLSHQKFVPGHEPVTGDDIGSTILTLLNMVILGVSFSVVVRVSTLHRPRFQYPRMWRRRLFYFLMGCIGFFVVWVSAGRYKVGEFTMWREIPAVFPADCTAAVCAIMLVISLVRGSRVAAATAVFLLLLLIFLACCRADLSIV